MDKKLILLFITSSIFIFGFSYYFGFQKGAQRVLKEEPFTPTPRPEIEFIKLLKSQFIDFSITASGKVKKVSNKTIELVKILENERESAPFLIEVKEDTKILRQYVLTEKEKPEEVKGKIELLDGKIINLGEKEITLEEIKEGDNVFVVFELLPDGNLKVKEIKVLVAQTEILQ